MTPTTSATRMLARQAEAEEAMVLGDPAPRMELWSRRDPVTLFGAVTGECKAGWDELSRIFGWVASMFSDVSDFRFDVEVAGVSGTWPTPWVTNASTGPSTAARSRR